MSVLRWHRETRDDVSRHDAQSVEELERRLARVEAGRRAIVRDLEMPDAGDDYSEEGDR